MKPRICMWSTAMCLFAVLVITAQATVVYTPVNVTLPAKGAYAIDLNHDGHTDFTFQATSGRGGCYGGTRGGTYTREELTVSGGGIVATDPNDAAALRGGVQIDSSQTYIQWALMWDLVYGCENFVSGPWDYGAAHRYLGLEFWIGGQVHYGWAELSTSAGGPTTLWGFAYETIPGKAITTGQPSSVPPEDSGPTGSLAPRPSGPAQPQSPGEAGSAIPVGMAAQDTLVNNNQHHHYKLLDLGTFGGPQSYATSFEATAVHVLNDRGMVTGGADTSTPDPYLNFCFNSDCFVSHAFQSRNGVLTDIGALPGGASSEAYGISANGLIAGISENGRIDPLIPGFPELRAVLWRQGRIVNLGTLAGGHESIATAVNNRGQVVGLATNTVPDPYSMFGTTEARAFLWQNGQMQDLGTLGGPDAMALFLNERGQVVGESYTNSAPTQGVLCSNNGFLATTGAFLWQNGKMVDLGSLGGICTFALDLNNRGQVVGVSDLAGDSTWHPFLWDRGVLRDLGTLGGEVASADTVNQAGDASGYSAIAGTQAFHAYLWRSGAMTDIGTVGSDLCSYGFSINSKDQIVGLSDAMCDFSSFRAFLWQPGGTMLDLNTLTPPGSALHLTEPQTINERGEITGIGVLPNGDEHAFLLVPCDDNHPGLDGCDYTPVGAADALGVHTVAAQDQMMDTHALDKEVVLGLGITAGSAQNNVIYGHCDVVRSAANTQLQLDGRCDGHAKLNACSAGADLADCPPGQKATSPTKARCNVWRNEYIYRTEDNARPCSY